ncbi:MAG TPA: hypothetical protein GXZ85_06580 [Firmicutes bacterium]|jgi:hypothetical protein|nr:hypothetical protein [Bacillota bacterium]
MGHTLPDVSYIDQIAALIKKDPSITVRQIANELKFADSKSVYYWLDKANVGGINEFRRQVLGTTSKTPGPLSFDVDGVPHYVVHLPLFDWNPQQKNPGTNWHYIHSHPHPRGLFAVRVGTNRYYPWFMHNDILIVAKGKTYPEESWVLLKAHDEFVIGKTINRQFVDPITLKSHPSDLTSVGLIVGQQRHFSS